MSEIINPCQYKTQSCINYGKVTDLVIQMVNEHYFDLQMFANYVARINSSMVADFMTEIKNIQKNFRTTYPQMPLFTDESMLKLERLVNEILIKMSTNIVAPQNYLRNIKNYSIFGMGATSPTILMKIDKMLPNQPNTSMPLILKIVPIQFPNFITDNKRMTKVFIESPLNAIYFKEAWMYCFSQTYLSKYTPAFNCISDCYITTGFPFNDLTRMRSLYDYYRKNHTYFQEKKWFNNLIDPRKDKKSIELSNSILSSSFGCFEMRQISGTFFDLTKKKNQFDLSMIFEYLYGKLVAAFVGRIIFTDDHFENLAYTTVNFYREYVIKNNGCTFKFYMEPGKMVQFIDLERYIFNFSDYDIYTNFALSQVSNSEYSKVTYKLARLKNSYIKNNYIFDKGIDQLLNRSFNENNFRDRSEYTIMVQILQSPFIHDIKTFCQIMYAKLPEKYKQQPVYNRYDEVRRYEIDLDDDKIRVITKDRISKNLL